MLRLKVSLQLVSTVMYLYYKSPIIRILFIVTPICILYYHIAYVCTDSYVYKYIRVPMILMNANTKFLCICISNVLSLYYFLLLLSFIYVIVMSSMCEQQRIQAHKAAYNLMHVFINTYTYSCK